MITGDNPLTACHVAKELEFTAKPILVLTEDEGNAHEDTLNVSTKWHWESVNRDINLPLDAKSVYQMTRKYDLCVTGEVNRSFVFHSLTLSRLKTSSSV